MIENEEIDILSLCLPTEKHFDAFKFASEKNITAIFCEKPLSYDLEEAEEMAKLSKDRVVTVNYFRRWNSTIAQLRERINQGIYGRVIKITVHYTKGIFVNGSQLVDLLRWFFGEPEEIHLVKIITPHTKDPGADFTLTFKDKFTAYFLNVPNTEYTYIDASILTEKGRIVLAQRGQTIEKYRIISEPYYQEFKILKSDEIIKTKWRNCLTSAAQEIVDCLKNGGWTSCTPEDALRALEICYKMIT